MKKIKFRAWDKKKKEMLLPTQKFMWGELPSFGRFETNDDFELMQFTGLLDNAGVLIYEGDILKYIYPHAPKYDKGPIKAIQWVGYRYDITDRASKNWKVIGNIWENKELLRGS
jgi:hypothetical protein